MSLLYSKTRLPQLTSFHPGLPQLPHPPKRRNRLLPLRRNNLPHKPRLQRRPQRNRLPHNLRPPGKLHPLHRLHSLQAPPPRTPPARTLVPRPSRDGDKYFCARVFGAVFYILFLPDGDAGGGGDDELEYCHVWGDLFVGDGVLCC